MPVHLLTVQADDFQSGYLVPRIRLSRFREKPDLAGFLSGSRLELRRPDGTRSWVTLLGISVEGITKVGYSDSDDASLYTFPTDPFVRFAVSSLVTDIFAPVGTEIWLIDAVDLD